MKVLLSLLIILLIAITAASTIYHSWKNKHFKIVVVQLGILGLAVILGIIKIYDLKETSIAKLLNIISP